MKRTILATLLVCITVFSFGQSEKFINAMKSNLTQLDSSLRNPAALLKLANNFERIAIAEKNQWLPYYYAAFCQVNLGFMEQDKDKVDGIADKANTLIKVADSLKPKNSEISCIKSMIASCHLMVNPMQRWMEFGQASSSNMTEAMDLDPSNPRPYFLKGQSLKYTPEQFGGGCKTAKPQFEEALARFQKFKPASDMDPNWGMNATKQLIADCK